MNKIVIYTSLTGGYDTLPQPIVIREDIDYICYSNDFNESQIGAWKIEKLTDVAPSNMILSRMPKILPHKYLSKYQYSIWIDSNIQIISEAFYNIIDQNIAKNSIFALVSHPYRECIYQEMITCLEHGKAKYRQIKKDVAFLGDMNYPANYGLYENGLIFRQHNNPKVIEINELWWKLFFNYSKRDQFWLCPVFHVKGFVPELLMPKGLNARNFDGLKYIQHTNARKLSIRFKDRAYMTMNTIKLKLRPIKCSK